MVLLINAFSLMSSIFTLINSEQPLIKSGLKMINMAFVLYVFYFHNNENVK